MGLFDLFRRRKEPGLFDRTAPAAPDEPQVQRKSWKFPGGSAVSVTVTSGDVQMLDANADPEMREQLLEALRVAGIDPGDIGAGGLSALPGGAGTIPAPTGDLVEDLDRLAQLRNSGALTEEEFAAAKAQLLGSRPPPSAPPPAA